MPRLLEVLAISLPVFALIALGVALRRSGRMGDEHQRFLTWFINTFALPALIFVGVARQDFGDLIDLPVIASTLGGTAVLLLLGLLVGRLMRLPPTLLGPAIFCAYWSNVTYMGFPLARNAYGEPGFAVGAIVNAFTMPVFVVSGIVTAQILSRRGRLAPLRILRGALANPIVLAALIGIVASLLFHWAPLQHAYTGSNWFGHAARPTVLIVRRCLESIGQVGLPMALIAIGHALRWQAVRSHRLLLVWTVPATTVLAPLLTWAALRLVFGVADPVSVTVAALLMGTPCAVACYVIGRDQGMDGPFIAAHLTISTIVSCITLPLWLYVLL
ncbi:MAG: AEC family transporter [Planctomycetota bacterium]